MIKRDYHNTTLTDALQDAEEAISYVRMNRAHATSTEDAEFIVGHGVIRAALIKLLAEHGITAKPQLGNAGVLVCVIE